MTTIAYDHQIFALQQFGGISRYICEIATHVGQCQDWRSVVVAPLHYNDHLASSSVARLGMHLQLRTPRAMRLYFAINALLSGPLQWATRADLLHRTYYSAKPRPRHGRLVVTVHDMIHELFPQHFQPDDPVREHKRLSVEAADHVICVSQNTADDLMRILNVPRSKISVTHLGFSQAFSENAGLPGSRELPISRRPYLLYVGHRARYKNFARVFDAYIGSARLQRDFDLVAFGGFPFTADEQAKIAGLQLRADAVRHQAGSDAVLANLYANAQVLVYPSEYEGFGIPPLEAMSCGCPVACSRSSSIPEVVGDAAEFFDPASVDSIRAALERLAGDDTRRRSLIAAGHLQSKRFSWDKCAKDTVATYSKVLEA